MTNKLLTTKSAKKKYDGGINALDGVNIIIHKNEIVAILGSSGAGKSTLIRSILGLVALDEGAIFFKSKTPIVNNFQLLRSSISTIYQNFNLVSRSTVLTNIILGKISGISSWRILFNAWPKGIQMEALALLKEVGLEDINLNKRVENLSGGQQQRIGIARALIGDPELILADEPVSSLDPETAKEILKLLKMTAKKKKISILCSLHQVEFAKYFADRIIGMNNGKIIFDKASNKLSKLDLNKIYK